MVMATAHNMAIVVNIPIKIPNQASQRPFSPLCGMARNAAMPLNRAVKLAIKLAG